MTVHSLKMYRLVGRSTHWKSSPLITVSVVADRWYFDKGREIEFLATGLPEQFAFIVDAKVNLTEGQRAGDSRAGIWAGLATRIGINRYQGIQSTGMSNEASGLIAFGTGISIPFGKISTSNVSGIAMGANIDVALAQGYADGVIAGDVQSRVSYPEFGGAKTPPQTMRTLAFGDAVEQNTKTIRQGPSGVRAAMYNFDGAVASTQFYPRYDSNDAVGGFTYAQAYTADYQGLITGALYASAKPISVGEVAEKKDGNGRTAVWRMYFLAGGTNTSPYQVHYLLMYVEPNGSFAWANTTGATPNPTLGASYASEAYTIFTDDKANTADNGNNREVLEQAYYAASMRSKSYVIKRPMVVPHAFNIFTNKTTSGNQLTQSWLISADFINHEYTIGE